MLTLSKKILVFLAGLLLTLVILKPSLAADSMDAIAIRVVTNPKHLSAMDWYVSKGFSGSPQSLLVDGYEAVRDGRTVYVSAPNISDSVQNLLAPGGFEADMENMMEYASTPGLINVFRTATDKHSGSYSLEIDANGHTGGTWRVNMPTQITGHTYTLSFWTKYISGSTNARVSLQDGAGKENCLTFPFTMTAGGWQKMSRTCTISGSGFNVSQPFFYIYHPSGSAGDWRIDDLSLTDDTVSSGQGVLNAGDKLYTNIYIISYNQNADNSTLDIFGQLLSNWKFNNNILAEPGHCSQTAGQICTYDSECAPDSCLDCQKDEYCSSAHGQVVRDTRRLADQNTLNDILKSYKAGHNNLCPRLASGSYLPYRSVSTWPSWQATLGQALDSNLPIDPINRFGSCPGYSAQTCWNEQTKRFADPTPTNSSFDLPADSWVYIYQSTADSKECYFNISTEDKLSCDSSGACTVGVGSVCGNNTCEANENCLSCSADCGACALTCDNDNSCETGENAANCPSDCIKVNQSCVGLPDHTVTNIVDKITQTASGSNMFSPSVSFTYNASPSTSECRFKCDTGYSWDGSTCVNSPINGTCGSANGSFYSDAPTDGLCSSGTPTTVSGVGPWTWTCKGISGGSDSPTCTANKTLLPVNGACGLASGAAYYNQPTTDLCSFGTVADFSGIGPWTWTCKGMNGGSDSATCTAKLKVNGTCGLSNLQAFYTQPSADLCLKGNPTVPSGVGPWNWTCQGINGGTDINCSAIKKIDGVCGSSSGGSFSSPPTTNLCSVGNPSSLSGPGPWTWTCSGQNGGLASSCTANKTAVAGTCGSDNGLTLTSAPTNLCSSGTMTNWNFTGTSWTWTCQGTPSANCSTLYKVNGTCGSSNGGSFSSAPTNNLCTYGNPTTVSGTGPWNWTCTGLNGGTTASCSASKTLTLVNGACGSSNGGSFSSAPTSNFCSAGTASGVSGTGPWNWTCTGQGGGTNASCSANAILTNGACGTANRTFANTEISWGSYTACAAGSGSLPTYPAAGSSATWVCNGLNGGSSVNCTALRGLDGTCGTANRTFASTETSWGSYTACATGSGSLPAFPTSSTATWICTGANGGANANCSAKKVTNGACGTASGVATNATPTTNLCSAGNPTTVSGTGPWSWACQGINGGSTDWSCTANYYNIATCQWPAGLGGTGYQVNTAFVTQTSLGSPSSIYSYDNSAFPPVNKCTFKCASGSSWNGTACLNTSITNCTELQNLNTALTFTYTLANDIDCSATSQSGQTLNHSGAGFQPINSGNFSFDGQGHTISNLYINRPGESSVGLFRTIGPGKTLQNVGLINASVTGGASTGALAGGAGSGQNGTISNCYSTGSVTGTSYVGGVVGMVDTPITNSYSSCTVTGTNMNVGGLVGWSSTVNNSYATGIVNGGDDVGGLAGYSSVINNSYATGPVTMTNTNGQWVGGLTGGTLTPLTVTNSYSTGLVRAPGNIFGIKGGGLVGGTMGSCTRSFWNTISSGLAVSACGASGLTTTQMKQQSTFTGWDFTATWKLPIPGTNYPCLQWQANGTCPQ